MLKDLWGTALPDNVLAILVTLDRAEQSRMHLVSLGRQLCSRHEFVSLMPLTWSLTPPSATWLLVTVTSMQVFGLANNILPAGLLTWRPGWAPSEC